MNIVSIIDFIFFYNNIKKKKKKNPKGKKYATFL